MSSTEESNCAVMGNVMSEMNKQSSVVPMAIVATLFFILGFATWLNGYIVHCLTFFVSVLDFRRGNFQKY